MEDDHFCLPSDLNYEYLFTEGSAFPNKIPFLFESPVDSVTETETDSDDEQDYLACLTRRMAQSFLHDDDSDDSFEVKQNDKHEFTLSGDWTVPEKSPAIAGAGTDKQNHKPKSTLSGEWSVPEKSPAIAGAAADKKNDKPKSTLSGDWPLPEKSPAITGAASDKQSDKMQLPDPKDVIYDDRQVNKRKVLSRAVNRLPATKTAVWAGNDMAGIGALGLPSTAWPPLQKNSMPAPASRRQPQRRAPVGARSSNAAVSFYKSKNESVGTGVFLPRIPGVKAEPPAPRKQAYSPVLVPARVVRALNLNLEQLAAQPRFTHAGVYAEYTLNKEMLLTKNNKLSACQKQRSYIQRNPDVHFLPREWTY